MFPFNITKGYKNISMSKHYQLKKKSKRKIASVTFIFQGRFRVLNVALLLLLMVLFKAFYTPFHVCISNLI